MGAIKKIIMPAISFVVARSYPDCIIGCENRLPWKLSTDLKLFKSITEHSVIIMGSKTYESIGKPLPNRDNIILSKTINEKVLIKDNNTIYSNNIEDGMYFADYISILKNKKEVFVIGGAEIFKLFISMGMVSKIYLTEVFTGDKIINGDSFFDYKIDLRKWNLKYEEDYPKTKYDEYPFRHSIFEKKNKYIRYRLNIDLLTDSQYTKEWLEKMKAKTVKQNPL